MGEYFSMKTTIVTTTINIPHFLKDYESNAQHYNHDVNFVVVGDVKSLLGTSSFCRTITNCVFLNLVKQADYLRRFSKLAEHLPVNSVERRNVGMLWAYEEGADIIITLDDDNLATTNDMIGAHEVVGTSPELPTYESSSGWFNVCSILEEKHGVEFYHRGYSPAHRWENSRISSNRATSNIVVNAGLWLDNPDVDAITRLERTPCVTGYKPGHPATIALALGTWSPFNCQNTALARKVLPAYFLSPHIGRHSDIFASYVIARLTEYFQDGISFGDPLVFHARNPHDLWKDLDAEREGMRLTDSFCTALRNTPIHAVNYHEGFGQIITGLTDWMKENKQEKIIEGMIYWHEAFERIGV